MLKSQVSAAKLSTASLGFNGSFSTIDIVY